MEELDEQEFEFITIRLRPVDILFIMTTLLEFKRNKRTDVKDRDFAGAIMNIIEQLIITKKVKP